MRAAPGRDTAPVLESIVSAWLAVGCVAWRKSSYSTNGGNCVEVAPLPDGRIAIRDSKDPDGPKLYFTRSEFAAFRHGIAAGEFDDLI
jgi:hypothetical protein